MDENVLDIRYIKLHFKAQVVEDCRLPKYKTSALRGGMGEMLLRSNCIRNRDCEACDFESECIVRRTMYSKFEMKPEFVQTGDSVGYVLECEDYREIFEAGDSFEFQLILFGKTMVYFSQYANAFYMLGQAGLGKEHARFQIVEVRNSRKEPILQGNSMLMENYRVSTVDQYVRYRMRRIAEEGPVYKIRFRSPLEIKYQGEELKEFNSDAILRNIQRRLYILNCFENHDVVDFYREQLTAPVIASQRSEKRMLERYSSRHDAKMRFHGIEGEVVFEEAIGDDLLPLYLAGELVHIGKNTSFGFGRYILKNRE